MAIYKLSTGKANSQDHVENGKYLLFDRSSNVKKSNKYLFDGAYTIVPGEGIFEPKFINGKFNLHQRVYAVSSNYFLPKYLFYLISKKKKKFYKFAVGSTVPSLRANSFLWINYEKRISKVTQQKIIDIIEPIEKLILYLNAYEHILNKIVQQLPAHDYLYMSNALNFIRNKPQGIDQISAKVLRKRMATPKKLEQPFTYKTNTFYIRKGTLLINTIRVYLEKFAISPIELDCNGSLASFCINNKFRTSVLSTLLNNNFWNSLSKFSKGSTMPVVKKEDILQSKMKVVYEIQYLFDLYTLIFNLKYKAQKLLLKIIKLLIK